MNEKCWKNVQTWFLVTILSWLVWHLSIAVMKVKKSHCDYLLHHQKVSTRIHPKNFHWNSRKHKNSQGQIVTTRICEKCQQKFILWKCPLEFAHFEKIVSARILHPYIFFFLIFTDTRPYACQFCHKAFTQRDKMVVHTRLHTGERPYVCDVCGKGFCESGKSVM